MFLRVSQGIVRWNENIKETPRQSATAMLHGRRTANKQNRGTNTPSVSQGSSAWLTHRKDKGNPFTLSLLVIDWLPSCAATTMGFGEKAAPRPYSSCPPGDGASTRPSSPSSEAPRS